MDKEMSYTDKFNRLVYSYERDAENKQVFTILESGELNGVSVKKEVGTYVVTDRNEPAEVSESKVGLLIALLNDEDTVTVSSHLQEGEGLFFNIPSKANDNEGSKGDFVINFFKNQKKGKPLPSELNAVLTVKETYINERGTKMVDKLQGVLKDAFCEAATGRMATVPAQALDRPLNLGQ